MGRTAIVFAVHVAVFVVLGLSAVFLLFPDSFLSGWAYHLLLVSGALADPRRVLYALAVIANGLAVPGLFLVWSLRKEPEAGWTWPSALGRALVCALGVWCLYVFAVLLALNFGPRIGAVAANTVLMYWVVVLLWNLTFPPLALLARKAVRAAMPPAP